MASIRDVARRAKVSPATVSRFLNQDPALSITKETKQRIEQAVSDLDYKKKSTVGQKKNSSVGILTIMSEEAEIDDPYFRSIRLGIVQEAKTQKIAANRIYRVNDQLDFRVLKGLGAVIIVGHMGTEILEEVKKQNESIIIADDPFSPRETDAIFVDLEQAMTDHLERLYRDGHREMVYIGGYRRTIDITGQYQEQDNDIRAFTYSAWMKAHNLTSRSYLGEWAALDGMRLTEKMLKEGKPTAIIAGSDPMAVGVYRAVQKAGLQIPEDISVVSFDNIEVASFLTPPLSTVDLEATELGRIALRMARDKIIGERTIPMQAKIPAKVIVRGSEQAIK
ncbi:LacI family DNA-binding transcriptional regulator [Enterococcus dispar]|uniref:LacI family DNA-binding transcriptional regulator n=1 Tax=Enterococcus dispar TaxID=44009 RepID=UPI00034069BF|nr:LacI family DNA-binding transcriptional regulator [Enterococcus dispar]EOW87056.1 hypothetical protein I569_02425 [Enterococcus dispar ATCC 51266]WCG33873.1 LacI family DNA-binding transcriptional regulator [Enterococcus dispar]